MSFFQGQDFIPEHGKNVNYTQLFFRWPQINNSDVYNLNLISNNNDEIYQTHHNSIIISNLNWGTEYSWVVCGFSNDLLIDCYEPIFFSINELPENYPNNINIISFDELQYTEGLTMLDYDSLDFSVILNSNGNPVWFADKTEFNFSRIIATQFLPSGNIVGFSPGRGYEFNLDSEILFETPQEFGLHHQIIKTSNDTYFFIDAEVQNHSCPIECSSNLPDEIPWQGDTFIEVDSQGNVIWEWSTFDYLSLNEYNPFWIEVYSGNEDFDWTHSNSIFLDEEQDIVYISIRNLSRITAIDYLSKNIIWNLGNSNFMDQTFFENDYGFSHQHSAQLSNEGNLLFFDNGRGNDPEVSRCLEIEFYLDQEPQLVWEHVLPDSLLTYSRGECDRLNTGNTLISCGRTGNVLEVNEENEIVWHLNVKDLNGNNVSIYRSERIQNLYPTFFSFKVNNLEGIYGNYSFLNNEDINFTITNNGWSSQIFKYEFYNGNNVLLLENDVFVENNNDINIFENISFNNTETCLLKVFSTNNPDNYQSIEFNIEHIIGDINSDFEVNVLDVVALINIILYNEVFNQNSDLNNDNIINILDAVILVNIILDN